MLKNKIKLLVTGILSVSFLFLISGCQGEEKKKEELTPEEKRRVNHTYDFIDYILLKIDGADGVAKIEELEMRKVKTSDFKNEKDFIRVKQIFNDANISADKMENIKNGDKIKISINPSQGITDKDKKLINLKEYTYTVKGLKKGRLVDLKKDIPFTTYTFETISDANIKLEKNSEYEMLHATVVNFEESKIKKDVLGGLLFKTYTDDKIVKLGNSVSTVKYGYAKEYIIKKNLFLSQLNKKKGLSTCIENLENYNVCSAQKEDVIKEIKIAQTPNFNFVDKKNLKANILSFINARFTEINQENQFLDDEEYVYNNFNDVVGIYKYNIEGDYNSSYNEHSELNKFRYAVLLSTSAENGKTVYALITIGMLQNGDEVGMFTLDTQNMELTMKQAGLSRDSVLNPEEKPNYSLQLETTF